MFNKPRITPETLLKLIHAADASSVRRWVISEQHESGLQKVKEKHKQQLEDVTRAKESSGFVLPTLFQFSKLKLQILKYPTKPIFGACRSSDQQQSLQRGLEEMKQQYLTTVDKIRGWLLCRIVIKDCRQLNCFITH